MKRLILLAALLAGCAAPAPLTLSAMAPTGPPAARATPAPTSTPLLFTGLGPGGSTLASSWDWAPQPPDPGLATLLDGLASPAAIARWLQDETTYIPAPDRLRWMPPAEFAATRIGSCADYARFWLAALRRQGREATFLAIWSPAAAHAVVVTLDDGGAWRKADLQAYVTSSNMGNRATPPEDVYRAAARGLYGAEWTTVLAFDPGGVITRQIRNPDMWRSPAPANRGGTDADDHPS